MRTDLAKFIFSFVFRLLHDLSFAQKKTRIGQMVNFVTANLLQSRSRLNSASELAQLLVVLSDGRGIFSEGIEPVKQAIRRAKEASIFMVFVIIDNPENKVGLFFQLMHFFT